MQLWIINMDIFLLDIPKKFVFPLGAPFILTWELQFYMGIDVLQIGSTNTCEKISSKEKLTVATYVLRIIFSN